MSLTVLRCKELEIPVPGELTAVNPEIEKMRNKFISGGDLSKEELGFLVGSSVAAAGNGNCNAC